jgi:uroporphyrinogen decarboxylase
MTNRQLWQNIMNYGEFDRMPVIHWTGWPETMERWYGEGMPRDVNQHEYFNAIPWVRGVGVNLGLLPEFEEKTLEENSEWRIFRAKDGVIQQAWKSKSCIPHFIDFTLKTAKDWPEYKKRLQPDPKRIPEDLDARIKSVEESGIAVSVGTASMMGWIRNWMGVVNMSYIMYDAPDVYADMVMTIADLACWGIDQVVPKMHTKPDIGFGWEDICGKSGPLVSPDIFHQYVAPGYRKMRAKLEEYGIHFMGIDSDGFVEPLLKEWLDAGVNVHFPIEIGTWDADTMKLRKKFGKDLHVIGGYNKLALEKGRKAIDAELKKRIPIMKSGGFILMPDHLITPGVPLDDYKYYLDQVRNLRL